jgi:glycolate dehydrogenase FAD-binding subunit
MTTDVGGELAAIVGTPHLLAGDAAAAFAVDGRAPRWVAAPGSVEEVSRCLALASTHGLAVSPTGGGTRRHWGRPPRALDLVLRLGRLDRVLAHEPADLTVSVEAGLTLGRLEAHVRPHRQFLPLDPPRAETSTIGGIVATAASGPYRARYGTIRDGLLGLTVVTADGTVVKGGGRVVKNVTGYDMPKLFVGGLGTLGVVVSAHLRLHPRPVVEVSQAFGFSSAEAATEATLAIMDAPVVVSRLELLDRETLAALGEATPPAAALAVSVGSIPEGARAQAERIGELAARSGGAAAGGGEWEAGADDWWRRVAETWWPQHVGDVVLRIGSRPADVVKALRVVEAAAGAGWACRAAAEMANGVLHATLRSGAVADVGPLLARVREGLAALEATCVVEHAPAEAKAGLDVWGDVGPALGPMRRLKEELDPRGILNPGRFVGGI